MNYEMLIKKKTTDSVATAEFKSKASTSMQETNYSQVCRKDQLCFNTKSMCLSRFDKSKPKLKSPTFILLNH